jgi:hypothetical protein
MKNKKKVKETEFERLKRWSSLSQKKLAEELYHDIEEFIDEKKLNAYIKKHKKEINDSLKRIDIKNVIKRVHQLRRAEK